MSTEIMKDKAKVLWKALQATDLISGGWKSYSYEQLKQIEQENKIEDSSPYRPHSDLLKILSILD